MAMFNVVIWISFEFSMIYCPPRRGFSLWPSFAFLVYRLYMSWKLWRLYFSFSQLFIAWCFGLVGYNTLSGVAVIGYYWFSGLLWLYIYAFCSEYPLSTTSLFDFQVTLFEITASFCVRSPSIVYVQHLKF
jgi:hypothetical protein